MLPKLSDSYLFKEWHPTLNSNLDLSKCTLGSNIAAWWVCDRGHEWQTRISTRAKGSKCPYCMNKRVIVGETDLVTTHPGLVDEWDYEENSLLPYEVSQGSDRRISWKCVHCNHKWKVSIESRVRKNTGCPRCARSNAVSLPEKEIAAFISSLGYEVQTSNRSIFKPYEIDIFVPERNLAIEYNGLHWHSDKFKKNNYHYDKWNACRKKGIQLIQIWEDDWLTHKVKVENFLKVNLIVKISEKKSNKFALRNLSKNDFDKFTNIYSLNDDIEYNSYLGLFSKQDNELFLVLSLKETLENEYLVNNLSIKNSGLNMLPLAISMLEEKIIMHKITFIDDNSYGFSKLLESAGAKEARLLSPQYSLLYRHRRLSKDSDIDNEKLPKIWDAGKTVWTIER